MLRDNQQFNESIKSNSAFLDELRQKMPEFFTATKYDEEGNVIESSAFDNDKFQQALKEHNIDELSSGYRLDFIGKNYAKKQAGERPTTVIVPDNDHNQKEENINSKNLFFTGDNLEVLRHLQQNYANSVDFIYIDPPYNTGSDGFVYPDKFEYSDDQLKDMFALNDDELKRLKSIQGKATHSAWLTFMYPRLYLAKKVLKDTGVIFVSIDDNEQANLKLLMDEVFGEGSFVQEISWRRTDNQPNIGQVAKVKEYILVYGKNISSLVYGRLPLSESALKEYRYEDAYAVKFRRGILLHKTRGRHSYPVKTKSGKILTGPWMVTEEKLKEMDSKGEIYWTTGGDEQPYSKIYLKDNKGAIPNDFWGIEYGTNQRASLEVESLLGKRLFDFPKPTTLIKRTLNLGTKPNSIVLDFFAGSSTTADAVMQLNAEDGGNRQYIMCTLPEPTFTVNSDGKEVPTKGGEAAYKAGYRSIDEISRERIIRAANKIKEENPLLTESQDFGFKHYRVVPPTQETLEKIDYDDQLQLDLFDDMIDAFSSEKLGVAGNADGFDTILHTYLAKDNYKFDVPLQMKDFAGIQLPYVNNQRIYLIANNWRAENTRALVNAIGKNELVVQTIVVYGYTLEMESLRELEIALNQLENKVNLQVRY
ncbi:TPA: site-specific DNA-methyltransferase [Enterococcus faecalis]|uniref:site-specific DNA-methyltransferase n=1 Tax=Enterococcus faecalis TaxID=1351 RepID=UPI001928F0B1|nr:site-specific DNA-methyltransferase [Enterococcus faecalis]MDH4721653.1 DNA methyltransferase [Enterococcus faecalis]UJQ88616.1 site-specific DNA-methyltransferase [Enterococcus faecalis]HAP3074929.1 site-specific DNA-methyltransferase [Enterococcus faecalis]HAP4459055.1 site-specific DNA-methyltransferase [Enterococcus faecalis]HAP4462268.1 site-specific DNA-methyltransferase [Enterococcus faecalis]